MRALKLTVCAAGAGVLALASAAPALASVSGTEYFTGVQTSATATHFPVIGVGPIHETGTDYVLNNNNDRFVFKSGSMVIRHVRKSGSQSYDPKTCAFRFNEQGVYRVVSGSGAYAHATGNGVYQLTGIGIGCSMNKPPSTFSLVLHASGPLKY